ncbi:ribosomal maturation YjgA family protein [Neobacillus cucumis]|uniref:ribosomal maturation YjgA family protein n=1 Tax=Neobacillus cucumis TaxID=1740721 RepID=UPI0028535605|nr:DUF2809 domain-containing protein [Neobacillus cucumis]MDR4947911.1 DUF2809 domain-containing protein [Neobacillus cucumis]
MILLKTKLSSNIKFRNVRKTYLIYIIAVIFLGLASRKYSHALPFFLAENAGDVLWAMMVYFGFRFLLVRKPISPCIMLSLLFSFGIEFSQMYQADWIIQIRSTWLGALVLGKVFLSVDLIRYTVGILLASLWDHLFFKNHLSSK